MTTLIWNRGCGLHSTSPKAIIDTLIKNRELLWQLAKREFVGRYKGSIMGVAWSFFHPVLMLAIYTVVFSIAFKARWGTGDESKVTFALVMFSGMILHALLAECLNRAPDLIVNHTNYVKKVVFPLEILPVVVLVSGLLHFVVSFCILFVFSIFAGMSIHPGVMLIPIVLLPLVLLTLGLSWLLASLGVYLRDLTQSMGIITTMLLFLSPVFYSLDALPPGFRILVGLNPLTLPMTQLRNVMFWGKSIEWVPWSLSLALGITVSYLGFWWFQKSRKGFADVL
jgi:lipopolysaccharide transport system permease protein